MIKPGQTSAKGLAESRQLERRFERSMAVAERMRLSGRHKADMSAARRSVDIAERLARDDLRARSLAMLGEHQLWLAQAEEAVATLRRASDLLESLPDPASLSRTLNVLTMAYVALGLHEEALSAARRGLEAAKASGDPGTLAWAYSRLAVPSDEIGDFDAARASLLLALGIARDLVDPELAFSVLNNLTVNAVYTFRAQKAAGREEAANETVAQARVLAEEALAAARRLGKAYPEAAIALNYGALLALGGEYELAREWLLAARAIASEHGFRGMKLSAAEELANVLSAQGDSGAAIRAYRAVLLTAERQDDGPVQQRVHLALSETYKRLGRYRQALAHHERFHALDRRIRTQVAETRARLLSTQLELDRARVEMERAILEAALGRVRNRELEAEKRSLEQQAAVLDRRANEDALTGLSNRGFAERELARLLEVTNEGSEPLSIALVDADEFKCVNDRLGHVVGDATLRRLAEILRASVRPTDLVARLGGDEFLVALPGASAKDAAALAERLRAGVCDAMWADLLGSGSRLTISVGVLTYGERREAEAGADAGTTPSIEALLTRADAALYMAKAKGRDMVEVAAA